VGGIVLPVALSPLFRDDYPVRRENSSGRRRRRLPRKKKKKKKERKTQL